MSRRDGKPSKSLSRRLDTKIAIYSPADYTDADNRGEFGEVLRATANETLVGFDMASIIGTDGSETVRGGKLGAVQNYTVEVRRRNDLATHQRIEVQSGYLAGTSLFVVAVDRQGGDRGPVMILICRQAKT